jgi:hypothetical protein
VSTWRLFGLSLGLLGVCGSGCNTTNRTPRQVREYAENEAETYLRRLYPNRRARVACTGYDSDGNGYVSCDCIVSGRPIALECGVIDRNDGCKQKNGVQEIPE